MQLPPGVLGVVDAADPEAQLEAQVLVVAQMAGHPHEVLARHEDHQLPVLDDDLLDDVVGVQTVGRQQFGEDGDDVVEPPPVGRGGRLGHGLGAGEPREAGGVARTLDPPHTLDPADHVGAERPRLAQRLEGAVVAVVAHAKSPFISRRGGASSAAASAACDAARRALFVSLCPRLTCSRSSRIALMSISGRGGQPGR